MELAAHSGLETMSSVETNPKERGLGKPCAGKPPARFDEGESIASGNRLAALSTLLSWRGRDNGAGAGSKSRVRVRITQASGFGTDARSDFGIPDGFVRSVQEFRAT